MLGVRIRGTGRAFPAQEVDASELDRRLNLAAGSSLAINGVRRRGFVGDGETVGALAARALATALKAAGLAAADLDAVLFASVMSEQPMPPTALSIFRRLHDGSAASTACYDINASCLGFLRALETAADAIAGGRWRNVGIVAADVASHGLDWSDLETATLFGDGAGAAVLSAAAPGEPSCIIGSRSATFVEAFELCQIKAGGSRYNLNRPPSQARDRFFQMDGPGLLRLSVARFPAFLDECLAMAGGAVRVVVPHQASMTALKFLRRLLARSPGTDMIDILAEHGNQVSASLPTAFDVAIRAGRIARGDTVLLIGTSAGVAMGGLALRY